MPHVTLEFSKGIEQIHDVQAICDQLFALLAEHREFDAETIKVRAIPIEYYRIGTDPQSFVHATLLLMQGRDEATRSELNAAILEFLSAALPEVGSITVQDVQMNRTSYVKRLAGP
ncbi:5-carboxymethyl-2-hydroxymuconate Delta-isomerase [Ruegeria atlantica]|uniref:5-carboxymethyl-2-hydroxymuconate isomerase n=1 Tax=Ruegeria atlantica TaxID=81569 RepID=A0A0P1EDL9_9RHOB|nr:5-carboxymethyl-2-hydroxymuconate Delta-isomerase [Ruegeria atlantica]CUH47282.1 5-carboxymethyl-2-hydroxymuconate isomerase [Ruegeria atlantica]